MLIILLLICLIIFFAQQTAWLVLLFLGLVVAFLWYLPKIVDLQQILPTDLTVAEGPGTQKDLQMKLDYRSWKEEDDNGGARGLGDLIYLAGFLAVVLIVVIFLKYFS
jgi:hypothetical protein